MAKYLDSEGNPITKAEYEFIQFGKVAEAATVEETSDSDEQNTDNKET